MAHYLLTQELNGASLSQTFTVDRQLGLRIKSVRPYLYVQGAPAGDFRIALFYNSSEIATTDTFTAEEIKTSIHATNDYCAVDYFKSLTQSVFLKKDTYEIKLIHSGYSYSPTDFIAWIIEHENISNEMSYTPVSDARNPFCFKLYRF